MALTPRKMAPRDCVMPSASSRQGPSRAASLAREMSRCVAVMTPTMLGMRSTRKLPTESSRTWGRRLRMLAASDCGVGGEEQLKGQAKGGVKEVVNQSIFTP
jgi:hypothetical protein